MGGSCWCCFCYCCKVHCCCCKHLDEEKDIGARGCCRYYDGDPMINCQCCCRFGKSLRKCCLTDPCSCQISFHKLGIHIEWKNKMTHKQGLLIICTLKISILIIGAFYLGFEERRLYKDWQKDLESRRFITGNAYRTKYYLSTAPPYDEDRFRRLYCSTALSYIEVGAMIIGDFFVLLAIAVNSCKSVFFCIVYIVLGTAGAAGGLLFQPIMYHYRPVSYNVQAVYDLRYLNYWIPGSVVHCYEFWLVVYLMREWCGGHTGMGEFTEPTEAERMRDMVGQEYRNIANDVITARRLTRRDQFFPHEDNSSYAMAMQYLHQTRNLDDRRPEPTLADLKAQQAAEREAN